MDWFLQRAKAFMATFSAAAIPAVVHAAILATGFPVSGAMELSIVAFLVGLVVHQTPNKTASLY